MNGVFAVQRRSQLTYSERFITCRDARHGLNAGMALSQLFDPEPIELEQPKTPSPATKANRDNGREIQRSIRQTLAQATKLKDLTFQAAVDMASCSPSSQEAMDLRARAQAIIALTKSWAEACDIVRVVRGKPLPGSLRPESKPAKRKQQPSMFTENKPE